MSDRWAILLYGLGISGGANVIFKHAAYAGAKGVEITFVVRERSEILKVGWHPSSSNFQYLTLDEAEKIDFDVIIATEWKSAFDALSIKAKKYVYFVQSIESKFYRNPDGLFPYIANDSYSIPFCYITEAGWIQNYLKDHYDVNAKLVRNGIDKGIFTEKGKQIATRKPDELRFLIEGSVGNWLKNVPNTVRVCRRAGVKEIWLVTPDEVSSYQGVDRVFSKVDIQKMGEIYRSCDVLVKLSLVEGMFGPPLEMFHCGGIAVVYGIEGAEEYVVDNENAVVVEPNNEEAAVIAIKKLINDADLVAKLKEGAKKTASEWYDWEEASGLFYRTVLDFQPQQKNTIKQMHYNCLRGATIYRWVERFYGAEPSNNRIKDVINIVEKEKKKLALYGAGSLCKSNIILLSQYDVAIDMVIVTEKEGNPQTVIGHKVISVNDIMKPEDYVVYITTEKYYKEIYNSLIKCGFKYIV